MVSSLLAFFGAGLPSKSALESLAVLTGVDLRAVAGFAGDVGFAGDTGFVGSEAFRSVGAAFDTGAAAPSFSSAAASARFPREGEDAAAGAGLPIFSAFLLLRGDADDWLATVGGGLSSTSLRFADVGDFGAGAPSGSLNANKSAAAGT